MQIRPSKYDLPRIIIVLKIIFVAVSLTEESFAKGDCPPDWPSKLPCPVSHAETVLLEHNDRKDRLLRLSSNDIKPEFFTDYLTPSEHGLADYPVEIPVLRVVFNSDVFFDTAQSEIRSEAYPILRIISQNMAREPDDVALFIVGHTDTRGEQSYNHNLGLARADAVAKAIARRGVYKADVYRLSFGELSPRDSNDSARGRARNRRVDFLFAATVRAAETWVRKQPIKPCKARNQKELEDCKEVVKIEVRKLAVNPARESEIVEINKKEEALTARTDLSAAELQTQLEQIELVRNKIPVDASRTRVVVSATRKKSPSGQPVLVDESKSRL